MHTGYALIFMRLPFAVQKNPFIMLTFQAFIGCQDRFSAFALTMPATGSLVRLNSLSQKNLLVRRLHTDMS